MRFTLVVLSFSLLISCRQSEKSNEVLKQAINVYLYSELKDDIKIDSSLFLIDKALELDDQNIGALNHKTTLLFIKKDSKGLIQLVDKLIELTDRPFYLAQKAMYLELDGNLQESKMYYSKAIEKYKNFMNSKVPNFDLMIEYVGVLESSGDSLKANKIILDMKEMNFEEYQKEMLDLYQDQRVSKKSIFEFWDGEIDYDQIGE
ncbi:MAG: hypothetical protein ACON5F_13395 [Jejuia sp.]